jgi:hypothetical protein
LLQLSEISLHQQILAQFDLLATKAKVLGDLFSGMKSAGSAI